MIIFFDIDGTLVDEHSQIIPASTVEAVAELNRRGHITAVNTGRPFGHIDPRLRDMGFRGWVCACGMEVRLDGQWLVRAAPTEAVCRRAVEQVRVCGMQVLYEAEDALYSDGRHSLGPEAVKEAARMQRKGIPTLEIDSLTAPDFLKFVTHNAPGCHREEFLASMEPDFACINRGGSMVEYVLKGYSKAGGMELLLAHLGADREQTLAIGDSTNDLTMFSRARHTVAMGDGMDELKAQAEFITDTVLHDGIAKALRHYGLIG